VKSKYFIALLLLLPLGVFAGSDTTPRQTESWLPLYVLGFGALIVVVEVMLIRKMSAKWTPYSVIRLLGITLIIIASLALVVGSGKENQISSVVGLLGTLAGYLLGKDAKEQDVMYDADEEGKGGGKAAESKGNKKQ